MNMIPRSLRSASIVLGTWMLIVVFGCGGATDEAERSGSAVGSLRIRVNWPTDDRTIPPDTATLRVSANANDGRKLAETVIVRPASEGIITNVPTGPVLVRGFAQSNSGKLLASGETTARIEPNDRNHVLLALSEVPGDIDDDRYVIGGTVTVDPDDPSLVRIALNALIRREDGRPVTGLNESNFRVYEDGILKSPITVQPADAGSGAVDLVFVIDTTGSMSEEIAGVRDSVVSFADSMRSAVGSLRLGGVSFGDEVRSVYRFAESADLFRDWVAGLNADGGGDTPENPLDAVLAANALGWRPGALRVIVVITDAPAHEANDVTSQTMESVASSLAGSVAVHSVSPMGGVYGPNLGYRTTRQRPLERDISALSSLTGGSSLGLPGNGHVDLNALGIGDFVRGGYFVRFRSNKATPPIDREIRLVVAIEGVYVADQWFPGRYRPTRSP